MGEEGKQKRSSPLQRASSSSSFLERLQQCRDQDSKFKQSSSHSAPSILSNGVHAPRFPLQELSEIPPAKPSLPPHKNSNERNTSPTQQVLWVPLHSVESPLSRISKNRKRKSANGVKSKTTSPTSSSSNVNSAQSNLNIVNLTKKLSREQSRFLIEYNRIVKEIQILDDTYAVSHELIRNQQALLLQKELDGRRVYMEKRAKSEERLRQLNSWQCKLDLFGQLALGIVQQQDQQNDDDDEDLDVDLDVNECLKALASIYPKIPSEA
ncbi:hypothetical protein HK098_004648 [Nowakowskiella sp. JEL0407]|nr:hypothetical protein HK098_004648 [Nowakowskiella sp. JEL0407]